MVNFRPHIVSWVTGAGEPQIDPVTGFPIPGGGGEQVQVACRWHADNSKEFRNEDNSVVRQQGRIAVDVGSPMPEIGQEVTVTEGEYVHFVGVVREVYRGQVRRWRVDV
ncbi:hypothetical protein [Pedobacter faecalis]|uniref:hypothetical protein n=1 Tax=Pedobacter faecalis TaxID=3041495 RepID=UPI0025509613|nr:hypothetical protein [Pedobacter sp. ELA7]